MCIRDSMYSVTNSVGLNGLRGFAVAVEAEDVDKRQVSIAPLGPQRITFISRSVSTVS